MRPAFHKDATIFGYTGPGLFAGPIQQLFDWNDENGVGVRLSPTNSYFGISDSEPHVTFPGVAALLNRFDLAYLHILESKPEKSTFPLRVTGRPPPAAQTSFTDEAFHM